VTDFLEKELVCYFCETMKRLPVCYKRRYDLICRPQNLQWQTSHCLHWRKR